MSLTTKSTFNFNHFTTTKNPYDCSNNRYTTGIRDTNGASSIIHHVYNNFNTQGTTKDPYNSANFDQYTNAQNNGNPSTNQFSHSNYNEYYSSRKTEDCCVLYVYGNYFDKKTKEQLDQEISLYGY